MDRLHSATAAHKKGQHLTIEERILIQVRLKDGWILPRIAEERRRFICSKAADLTLLAMKLKKIAAPAV